MTQLTTNTQGNVPAFVAEKLATLAGALEYAKTLCDSKILPSHFYEKDSNGKPDYSKPKPATVVVVLQYGQEIGMSHMQAIQQLVPVNNLVGIKGDGAKALIMGSGKVETWKEEEVGTPGKDDWGFKITCKRKDTGETKSEIFTVFDAKRAGLWVDEAALSRNSSLKFGPWFKFPKRMLRYRALGFIARDMFSDVLQGVHIEEEIDNTINADVKVVTSETLRIDTGKADNTAQLSEKVLAKVEVGKAKPSKKESTPVNPVESPEEKEKKDKEMAKAEFLSQLNNLQPSEIAEKLKTDLPFDFQLILDAGHKKSVKLAKDTLLANFEGRLTEFCKELGVDILYSGLVQAPEEESGPEAENEPVTISAEDITVTNTISEPPRDMNACVDLAEKLEAKGVDVVSVAFDEGFATDEEFLKHSTVEQVQKYLTGE